MTKPEQNVKAAEAAARASLARDPAALTEAGSRMHWQQMLQMWATNQDELHGVAQRALAGDAAAQRACLEVSAGEISSGRVLSPALAKFITAFLTDNAARAKSRRGRDPSDNYSRDFRIALAVFEACEAGGLKATRSATTKAGCGCSVVADVLDGDYRLNISEDAVKKIWNAHSDLR